jgi:hypothetical protein
MKTTNTFTIKKLAEVQAFIKLKADILERSGSNFKNHSPSVYEKLKSINADLNSLVADEGKEVFDIKIEATQTKLTKMMELYVGDSWDDPVEVLEWLSFYSGSASAHCVLAASALSELGIDSGYETVKKLADDFFANLGLVKESLAESAKKRVQTS